MWSLMQYELLFSALFFLAVFLSRERPKRKGEEGRSGAALAVQISDWAGTKYSKAMDLFLSHPAGDFATVPTADYVEMVTALAAASVRVGRPDRLPTLFVRLCQREGRDCGILATVARLLASRRHHAQALQVLEWWKGTFKEQVPSPALSCLLHSAVEAKESEAAEAFMCELRARGDAQARDFQTVVRLYAQQRPDKALATLKEMEENGFTPDNVTYNIVLSACSTAKKGAEVRSLLAQMPDVDIVTYNTQMKAAALERDVSRGFELFRELQAAGIEPSQVTFGTLVECCTRAGAVERAYEVLRLMEAKGVPKNNVVYTSMISGLTAQGRLEEAMAVFESMAADKDVEPDVICYSVLIKAFCDDLQLEVALKLFEQLLQSGTVPDEILFNNLLSGCAQRPHVRLGEKVFEDMVAQGIKPTVATFSILVKMHLRAGEWQASQATLEAMPARYGIAPAMRLYMQHVSYCTRKRKGGSLLHVYALMHERFPHANYDHVLQACRSFNLLDTCCELLEIDAARFSAAEVRATLALLVRKQKPALAARVSAALR